MTVSLFATPTLKWAYKERNAYHGDKFISNLRKFTKISIKIRICHEIMVEHMKQYDTGKKRGDLIRSFAWSWHGSANPGNIITAMISMRMETLRLKRLHYNDIKSKRWRSTCSRRWDHWCKMSKTTVKSVDIFHSIVIFFLDQHGWEIEIDTGTMDIILTHTWMDRHAIH